MEGNNIIFVNIFTFFSKQLLNMVRKISQTYIKID